MSDNELLLMLFANLRNAEATFGPGSVPVSSIRKTMLEHLQSMQAKGAKTDLSGQSQRDADEFKGLLDGFQGLGIRRDGDRMNEGK